ncbi:MAG: hypothetical protein PF483_10810 [Halothiobacillus sp.]|jgi:hypothetical protein|nr:hypothetical protein [Halothiobacillus sp.]
MDLSNFKALIDANPAMAGMSQAGHNDQQLTAEIKECFPAKERSSALSCVRQILDDLGLRYLCDCSDPQPYLGVAETLQQALKSSSPGDIWAAGSVIDWERAVQLGLSHSQLFTSRLPLEQRWIADAGVCSMSKAIQILRNNGFRVELPPNGGINIPVEEMKRLSEEILRLAVLLGRSLVSSAVMGMRSSYSSLTGRFNIGRNVRIPVNVTADSGLS